MGTKLVQTAAVILTVVAVSMIIDTGLGLLRKTVKEAIVEAHKEMAK